MLHHFCSFPLLHQENTETRRKSSKRTFKSEKEFLEFTLKYQQVLAERDAGKLKFWLGSFDFCDCWGRRILLGF